MFHHYNIIRHSLYRIIALISLLAVPAALPFQIMLRRIRTRYSVLQLAVVHHGNDGGHRCDPRRQSRVRPLRPQGLRRQRHRVVRHRFSTGKRSDVLPQRRYRGQVFRRSVQAVVRLKVRPDLACRGDRVPVNRRRGLDRLDAHRHGFR